MRSTSPATWCNRAEPMLRSLGSPRRILRQRCAEVMAALYTNSVSEEGEDNSE